MKVLVGDLDKEASFQSNGIVYKKISEKVDRTGIGAYTKKPDEHCLAMDNQYHIIHIFENNLEVEIDEPRPIQKRKGTYTKG